MIPVNIEDPYAYELISMVIDEFEQSALESGRREGILAVANAPLSSIEDILDGSAAALHGIHGTRDALAAPPEQGYSQPEERLVGEGIELNVDWDVDLLEFLPGRSDVTGEGSAGRSAQQYIEECLGCSLRLSFDFQLQPIMQNNAINDFLDRIDAALDRFAGLISPVNPRMMRNLCWTLDHLRGFCIPDIIMILMALKMLMKKYMQNTLSIKVDWTVLVGPIVRAIVQGISLLLDNLAGIILAPLECSLAGMRTANKLFNEIQSTVAQTQDVVQSLNFKENFKSGEYSVDSHLIMRDVDIEEARLSTQDQAWAEDREEDKAQRDRGFIAGYSLDADLTLDEALRNPAFMESSFLEKLIVAVQDAAEWLRQIVDSITRAFESLNSLVGSGIELNLENLGVMLFIFDMISLVQMIIRLLRGNASVTDWCTLLQNNPEILESELRSRFGEVTLVSSEDNSELVLRHGPDIVGSIKTCVSARTDIDKQVLNQWISDLINRGNG